MPAEHAAIGALRVAAYAEFARYLDPATWLSYRAELHALNVADGSTLAVALLDGELAGTVTFIPPFAPREPQFPKEWAVLRMLAVAPARRRAGVGRHLARWCVERAEERGAAVLGLATAPFMLAAIALYARLGFRRAGRVPTALGVELEVMRFDLTSAANA